MAADLRGHDNTAIDSGSIDVTRSLVCRPYPWTLMCISAFRAFAFAALAAFPAAAAHGGWWWAFGFDEVSS